MIKNVLRFLSSGVTGIQTTLRGSNSTSAKLPGNGKCVRQLESTNFLRSWQMPVHNYVGDPGRAFMSTRSLPAYCMPVRFAAGYGSPPVLTMGPCYTGTVIPNSLSMHKSHFNGTNPPMPFLGMDMGGTLTKLVFFEPKDSSTKQTENELLSNVTKYLTKNSTYGKSGHRDAQLQMDNVQICDRIGTLHFIRFPTSEINNFLDLCKNLGMADSVSTVCATGGGAIKFKDDFKNKLNLKLRQCDEMHSLIRGLIFTVTSNNNECYSWSQCTEHQQCLAQEYTFQNNIYPFIVVNIGTGTSVLAVYGPNNDKRISGIISGGEVFSTLSIFMTKSNTFDEAIEMAAKGDNFNVDKSIHDIYGADYSEIGLSGEEIACSFAKLNSKEKWAQVSEEDRAKALLVFVSKIIASNVITCARYENIERVYFVGNFLRGNPISRKIFSDAMAKSNAKALFLNHEGYLGAIGSLLSIERFKK